MPPDLLFSPHLYNMYLITPPWWLRMLYPGVCWRMPGQEKVLYLSFDDGPHEQATPFVLEQLADYNAKASFFCIGKNVEEQPALYKRILDEGHSVGNHTYRHLNGWNTADADYLADIRRTEKLVSSPLFRPPYGRIRRSQLRQLQTGEAPLRTIMWDVLSGDFDAGINGEKCLQNVIRHARPGSIIVFHDSAKAWERLFVALPQVLQYFAGQGYAFRALDMH